MMNRTAKALALAMVASILTVAAPVAASDINTSPDQTLDRKVPLYNGINYWFQRAEAEWCQKVNQTDEAAFTVGNQYVTKPTLLVINQGQMTFLWEDPKPGDYAGPYNKRANNPGPQGQGWSNAILCGGPKEKPPKEPKSVAPRARIIGPAGDPFFRYVLDNRRSERAVTFNVTPWGRKVTVPAGCVFRTGWHYERPYVRLTIKRGNGTVLAKRNSGPGGYYGPLFKGYQRGMDCPA